MNCARPVSLRSKGKWRAHKLLAWKAVPVYVCGRKTNLTIRTLSHAIAACVSPLQGPLHKLRYNRIPLQVFARIINSQAQWINEYIKYLLSVGDRQIRHFSIGTVQMIIPASIEPFYFHEILAIELQNLRNIIIIWIFARWNQIIRFIFPIRSWTFSKSHKTNVKMSFNNWDWQLDARIYFFHFLWDPQNSYKKCSLISNIINGKTIFVHVYN